MSESSNVVDVRPDRFLREMRDTGDFGIAAQKAHLSVPEVEELCKANAKFDLSVIECHLEYLEEKLEEQKQDNLRKCREAHMAAYRIRHPA